MLHNAPMVGFVPTLDLKRSRPFYEETLGLEVASTNDFGAVVFRMPGGQFRLTTVPALTPQPFTILGWQVADVERAVLDLREAGVEFQHYGLPGQDPRGIWKTPEGDLVAWFKDPEGNLLSLSSLH